ncbi:methionine--tRNA ligase [Egicoccus halophilus]|uniref:Methionine--tRNA ligase n=1 Tax=Egicoccus halophilus TaxID=1670830 RepID=A0A8J3ABR0_9ACTN|nr:methionine--tRNA ligase [Egicoccus halophilus]GGI03516.1 methionine--tRNA ligase [Egicoccus halophilus]
MSASDTSAGDPRHVLVAVAWPYANGLSHLGHIAGCYLPADVFARYHRISGNRVLMVSGTDAHGTPITVKADQDGVEPADVVNRYNPRFHEQWERLGISFDLFTTTMTDNHREVTWELFRALHANGYIDTRTTEQFYDPQAGRFLPDRYVEGTCPHCGSPDARGDQCETCGKTLDPIDLIDPRSKFTGATPEPRETEHYFILLPRLQEDLLRWLEGREGWRGHVINWALGFVREGLIERAITRDLAWGVPLPPELDISTPDSQKRIYVWFEAVIGYLSASKEWAQRSGDPDAWKAWWLDPAAESYYFIGKDNIPFHAVFWPTYLLGSATAESPPLNLPTNVPANQYVTFRGAKASKSRGIGKSLLDYLDDYQPDELRYALATILPEYNDTDLTEDELVRRINGELVAAWGNLVNRVLAMTRKNFDGVVPEPGELDERDRDILATVDRNLAREAELLERVELRAGLKEALDAAQEVNAYLNATEPWKTAKTDLRRTGTTLWTALQAIAGCNLAFAPYTPFAAAKVGAWLGHGEQLEGTGWQRREVPAGSTLGAPTPLFRKVELPEDDGDV